MCVYLSIAVFALFVSFWGCIFGFSVSFTVVQWVLHRAARSTEESWSELYTGAIPLCRVSWLYGQLLHNLLNGSISLDLDTGKFLLLSRTLRGGKSSKFTR